MAPTVMTATATPATMMLQTTDTMAKIHVTNNFSNTVNATNVVAIHSCTLSDAATVRRGMSVCTMLALASRVVDSFVVSSTQVKNIPSRLPLSICLLSPLPTPTAGRCKAAILVLVLTALPAFYYFMARPNGITA
jgi:hypothetical protein